MMNTISWMLLWLIGLACAGVILHLLRNRKRGRSSCHGDCSACGGCHLTKRP